MSRAKREIARFIEDIGFSEEQKGKIDIVVSELCSNLIKHHTLNGEILVKRVQYDGQDGVEILSVDNGPGMKDLNRMMEDGVSTFGSKGEGLGAIKRLSQEFDIYSLYGTGTFILSRFFLKKASTHSASPKKTSPILNIKVVMVPKEGEEECGDGWAQAGHNDEVIILASDGLGHGKEAHVASQEAIDVFTGLKEFVPCEMLKEIHNSIRHTRGIVGAVARINVKQQSFSFCGIGNISGRLFSYDGVKSLVSYNGTVGHNIPNVVNEHTYKWDSTSMLILHSDGLKSRWNMSSYPGIERHDTSLLAAVLYKDNTRKRDDALVIVVRN